MTANPSQTVVELFKVAPDSAFNYITIIMHVTIMFIEKVMRSLEHSNL